MGKVEFFGQLAVGFSRLQRHQVCPLDIFDQSQFQAVAVIGFPLNDRNNIQAGDSGSPPAAFTGDENVLVIRFSGDDQRLQNAMLADRIRPVPANLLQP